MSEANLSAVSVFVEGAPPGELDDVVDDIKALTVNEPKLIAAAEPAFQKYNEEQLTTVKLPGGSQNVLVSQYNGMSDGRYFDVESSSSFAFDHLTQKASAVQSYTPESSHLDLIKSLLKPLSTHAAEHYVGATYTVCPASEGKDVAILLVANRYSPSNFWNGRWRATYILTPGSSLKGKIQIDVHYYEDGNVRLTASKDVDLGSSAAGGNASEIIRSIAAAEKSYQSELNRGFANLNDNAFKGLRRQLPVTRQKVEWEKIGGYRLGQDIGGGRTK